MVEVAKITTERGSKLWHCPSCGRVLAEIRDGTVTIKAKDRYIVILFTSVQRQRCPNPKCGTWSEVRPD